MSVGASYREQRGGDRFDRAAKRNIKAKRIRYENEVDDDDDDYYIPPKRNQDEPQDEAQS